MTHELFALKAEKGVFRNFFSHIKAMSLCGPPPYYRVRLTPDPDGAYWTWHDFEKGVFLFTNANKLGVEICFPYGTKPEIERGHGDVIRVRVDEIGVAE